MQLTFSSPVLSTHCGRFLAKYLVVLRRRSISQYFFVCQFCQHARDTHDIHHAYILASFSAFLHFLMFACKVACLGCFHFQKQVWACHLSNRLSPIKQKKHILPSVPHWVHFSWKKVVSVSPLKEDEKIPSRVRSSLGIKSCLTVSLRFIPGQNPVFSRSKSGFPSMIARVYL